MNILVLILLVVLIFGPGIFHSKSLGQFFWSTIHNGIAHPLLCSHTNWSTRFHDWSGNKMVQSGKVKQKWFVVRESGGKFADGYYGWDGRLGCEDQIFPEDALPYVRDSPYQFIEVGEGKDCPSLEEAQNILRDLDPSSSSQ